MRFPIRFQTNVEVLGFYENARFTTTPGAFRMALGLALCSGHNLFMRTIAWGAFVLLFAFRIVYAVPVEYLFRAAFWMIGVRTVKSDGAEDETEQGVEFDASMLN